MALRPTRFESSYPIGENATPTGGVFQNKATVELVELPSADGNDWTAETRLYVRHPDPIVAMGGLVAGLRALADQLEGDHQAMAGFQAMAMSKASADEPKSKKR